MRVSMGVEAVEVLLVNERMVVMGSMRKEKGPKHIVWEGGSRVVGMRKSETFREHNALWLAGNDVPNQSMHYACGYRGARCQPRLQKQEVRPGPADRISRPHRHPCDKGSP
jgi:hypothetical protein